jgi:hypothetical protein
MGTRVVKIATPGPRIFLRKLRTGDGGSQVAARAYFLIVGHKASHRGVGKFSGCVGHGNRLFHVVRLSDLRQFSFASSAGARLLRTRNTWNPAFPA